MDLQRLLPLCGEDMEWTEGVKVLLTRASMGPGASGVHSGLALFDLILGLRYESRMQNYGMLLNASHGLDRFFDQLLPESWSTRFFSTTLPFLSKLALKLPSLLRQNLEYSEVVTRQFGEHFPQEVCLRVLPSQKSGLVFLSQEMAASVLACAFLCLFPDHGRSHVGLPRINFDLLFAGIHDKQDRPLHQKLMCILHYFDRICQNMPQGMVSYERKVLPLQSETAATGQCVPLFPDASFWSSSKACLCEFKVMEEGTIEDQEGEVLEVDFANRYLGGGALKSGCVQEEIRFMICPELIAGMLFMPEMDDNEAIEIFGAERYSSYTGYGSSFAFAGDYTDSKARDVWGRRKTRILAIDAIPQAGSRQYQPKMVLREVNKAFCGFAQHLRSTGAVETSGVATGNWGCGAFGGDVELKAMIQWLAASQAGRPFIAFYTFGDARTRRLQEIVDWLKQELWRVAEVWTMLISYVEKRSTRELDCTLFDWLLPR